MDVNKISVNQKLMVTVKDYDLIGSDDLMGTGAFVIDNFTRGKQFEKSVSCVKGKIEGKVHFTVKAVDFGDIENDLVKAGIQEIQNEVKICKRDLKEYVVSDKDITLRKTLYDKLRKVRKEFENVNGKLLKDHLDLYGDDKYYKEHETFLKILDKEILKLHDRFLN